MVFLISIYLLLELIIDFKSWTFYFLTTQFIRLSNLLYVELLARHIFLECRNKIILTNS